MAEEIKKKLGQDTAPALPGPVKATKKVRNRSGQRIELVINDKVVVFPPGSIVDVPKNFDIPAGIGLFVRG